MPCSNVSEYDLQTIHWVVATNPEHHGIANLIAWPLILYMLHAIAALDLHCILHAPH